MSLPYEEGRGGKTQGFYSALPTRAKSNGSSLKIFMVSPVVDDSAALLKWFIPDGRDRKEFVSAWQTGWFLGSRGRAVDCLLLDASRWSISGGRWYGCAHGQASGELIQRTMHKHGAMMISWTSN